MLFDDGLQLAELVLHLDVSGLKLTGPLLVDLQVFALLANHPIELVLTLGELFLLLFCLLFGGHHELLVLGRPF